MNKLILRVSNINLIDILWHLCLSPSVFYSNEQQTLRQTGEAICNFATHIYFKASLRLNLMRRLELSRIKSFVFYYILFNLLFIQIVIYFNEIHFNRSWMENVAFFVCVSYYYYTSFNDHICYVPAVIGVNIQRV